LAGGAYLLVNAEGRLWRVPLGGPELLPFETGFADRCNNDHGFSPDGQWLALSCHRGRGSELFVVAAGGGVPRLLVPDAPSWFHGWFPDGSRIVYAAARRGRTVDIYSAAADGSGRAAADVWRGAFGRAGCVGGRGVGWQGPRGRAADVGAAGRVLQKRRMPMNMEKFTERSRGFLQAAQTIACAKTTSG
jgi:hypothetical protein